jgi:signal peptidase II
MGFQVDMRIAMPHVLFALVAEVGAVVDLLSKSIVFQHVALQQQFDLIPGVLAFRGTHNTGIVWGSFQGWGGVFTVVTMLALPLIVWMYVSARPFRAVKAVALGMVLAGAIGNLFDRLFFGHVRDFIDFYIIGWPVFNLADVFICVGVAVFAVVLLRCGNEDRGKVGGGKQ